MPEITLPEVKLPEFKVPDGLREMTRDDIVNAAKDVKLPKQIKMPDIDLSKVDLPKEIEERMPGRRRTNPMIPLLALTVVGLAVVAAWWLFTSATTGPRVRRAVDDLRTRMQGEPSDLIRYDNEEDLGSLRGQQGDMANRQPYATEPFGTADVGEMGYDNGSGVPVGPGGSAEEVRSTSF
jgi:hypothetical protein